MVGAATVAYFFLAVGAQSNLNSSVAVASAALMGIGVLWHRPEPRFGWTLLALGVLMLAGGDILYGISSPVPSPADMLYISAYPLLALGLVAIARGIGPEPNYSKLAEAVVIVVGVAITAIVFLLVPAGQARGVGTAAKLVAAGYPLMDLVLLAILVRPLRVDDERRVSFALFGAGLLFMSAADAVYMLLDFGTAYRLGSPADAAWLLSYAFFGAAVLHPSVAGNRSHAQWGAARSSARTAPAWPSPLPSEQLALKSASFRQAHALRFRLVLAWAGLMLLGLAISAVVLGAMWQMPNVVILSGTYGGTGTLILLASLIRS